MTPTPQFDKVNTLQHVMRRHAIFLTTLMLSALFMVTIQGADTTISTSTTWSSDDYILQGNVTVSSGTTLTIDDISTVDTKTYSIIVEGVLRASNTTFFSSEPPLTGGSQGQGMWSGIHVAPGGSVYLDDVQISNAESALYIEGSAQLNNIYLNHSYIGIRIDGGSVSATSIDIESMDFDGVRLESSGMLSLDQGSFSNVSIGIQSDGFADVSNLAIHRAGIGFKGMSGQLLIDQSGVYNSTIGYVSQQGVQMRVNNSLSFDTILSLDAGDADDFEAHHGSFEGDRFLFSSGSESLMLDDVAFSGSGDEQRYAMDVKCSLACSFTDVTITNASKAIQLSGAGPYDFDRLEITNSDRGIDVVGDSILSLTDTNIETEESALDSQGASTSIENSIFELLSNSRAVSLVQGSHQWDGVTIQKQYSSQDHTSTGLYIWYSLMESSTLSLSGWSNGIVAQSTDMVLADVSITQGVDIGLDAENSKISIQDLATQSADTGIEFDGYGPLQIVNWTADVHQTPLLLENNALANIRSFRPINTAPNAADAMGDGTLYYGSNLNPTVATTASHELIETPVTFTDLIGDPIEATIVVHGFEMMSNANGAANIPLVSSGSVAEVTYLGAGVQTTLYGGQNGQSVQVPVIPAGDWTISSGQSVVLGPRPDGQAHLIGGDLTIQTNAQLTLVDTAVVVPSGSSVQLEGSGVLYGRNAHLTTDMVSLGASSFISGFEGIFEITGDVAWSCLTKKETDFLFVDGDVTLQPNCEVDLYDGYVDGDITAWTGAKMTLKSSLAVTVLDKGEAISGAVISIDGAISQTDTSGQITAYSNARVVDESGEVWGGRKVITLQYGTFNDFISWETNASLDHTFMVSTVPIGTLNDWFVLEKRWSPYVLTDDLTVGLSGVLTINDGVELRIAADTKITVNGQLDAGNAILSSTGGGSPWAGLETGTAAGSLIELSGTSIAETSPAVHVAQGSGTFIANDATFARSGADSLVVVESGSSAIVEITNSTFSNAGLSCFMAYQSNAKITMNDVSMSDCGDVGVSIQQNEISISGISLDGTMSSGINLLATHGILMDVTSDDFTGSSPFLTLYDVDEHMQISNVNVNTSGGLAMKIEESVLFDVADVHVSGTAGIEIIESSGNLHSVTAEGSGVGTGIDVEHGKFSSSLSFVDIDLTNYAIGMSFHEDEQGNSAPALLRDVNIVSSTAIAADRYDLRIEDSNIDGEIQAFGSSLSILDSDIDTASLSEGSKIDMFRRIMVEAQLDGTPIPSVLTWTVDGLVDEANRAEGVGLSIELLVQEYTDTGSQDVQSIVMTANAQGYPLESIEFNPNEIVDEVMILQLTPNQAPTLSISSPYPGQRIMETEYITSEITVSDDLDSVDDVVILWVVQDSQGNEVYSHTGDTTYNITDLSAGFYLLLVEATDTLGSSSSRSVDFEVTLLDTDGDWLSTCNTETWFDASNGRSCGPDVYDGDDDDDGVSDEKDAFPLDACAAFDTDNDGQPDTIDCPEGMTTWLNEDDDDDGDGVPDLLEGEEGASNDDDLNLTLLAVVLMVVLVVFLLVRSRRGGGSSVENLDLSSLAKRDVFDDNL